MVIGRDDLAHTKNVKLDTIGEVCESLISDAEASDALSESAKRQSNSDCFFSSENYGLSVEISGHPSTLTDDNRTTFEGNPAFTDGEGDCQFYVQVASDPTVYLGVFVRGSDVGEDKCSMARAALRIVFDNAPDA
jgi:hypothetical protein